MYKIDYQLKLQQSAVISDYMGENNQKRSLDYIPGNILLGIIAAKISKSAAKLSIKNLVKDNVVLFGNAVIGSQKPAEIIPMGFYYPKGRYDLPTVLDSSDDFEVDLYKIYSSSDELPSSNPHKSIKNGWFNFSSSGPYRLFVKKETSTHNIINPESQRPDEKTGGIFVYETLSAGQSFFGQIKFIDEGTAKDFYNHFGPENEVKIGRSLGAEYGSADLTLTEPVAMETNFKPQKDVQIVLHSDLITKNVLGVYETMLTADTLTNYLKENGIYDLEVLESEDKINYVKSRLVSGFNAHWGQNRSVIPAIIAGSVFHFTFSGNDVAEAMKFLFEYGIGERRNEGYGQISFRNSLLSEFFNGSNHRSLKYASLNPESISSTQWYEVKNMPETIQLAVFTKQMEKEIFVRVKSLLLNDEGKLHKRFDGRPSNSQLMGLRNRALSADSVEDISTFMENKREKKAHKSGQWNVKLEEKKLFDFFINISNKEQFYLFLKVDYLPEPYNGDHFSLLLAKMFVSILTGLIIKRRNANE